MNRGWLALALMIPLFAGCLGEGDDPNSERPVAPTDVGYDADELRVDGFVTHDFTVPSGDVNLAAILYEPQTTDSIDGEDPTWPLVVLVHPWGFPKETYENTPLAVEGSAGTPQNLMQQFAESGLMVVAYDTRGWGETGGTSTVAGEAEMRDLRAVIDYVNKEFKTNGNTGVAGTSYGGGHAFRAWAEFDDVVTAVPHNPWVDLYEGVFPGNVPKLEWGTSLYTTGSIGGGNPGPNSMITDWLATGTTRQSEESVDGLHRQLDSRSILEHGVMSTDKPLFVCSGLQDTLFNQIHTAWMNAPGFTRAKYYSGGHNTLDQECWLQTIDWFLFFLAGIDTKVDSWPFLESVDASGNGPARQYTQAGAANLDMTRYHLREQRLVDYADSNRSFTIAQRLVSNPAQEPTVVWESTGQPQQEVPEQFRDDPSGILFESTTVGATATILGAPKIHLQLAEGTETPFQVTATLYLLHEGSYRTIGHGATSPVGPGHVMENSTTMNLPWLKLDLQPEDKLVLKLTSSDTSIYAPMLANFEADFTGASYIDVPFFAPPARGG